MIADYLPLLSALVALLVGLAAGKAWERYKLHEGRRIDDVAHELAHRQLGVELGRAVPRLLLAGGQGCGRKAGCDDDPGAD